jgi:phospholipid/cholesterol/gamma-HCH transport system substrate-binding protein
MPEPTPPIAEAEAGSPERPVRHLAFKAALLLLFTVVLIAGSVLYMLYARGAFEPTQRLVLVADVPTRDAHWLRSSSVFTLVRGLVGGTTIKAFTGVPTDPPLPDGAERPVLRGDATAELPQVLSAARQTLENLAAITAEDAALRATLDNLRATTGKLNGPGGALGAVFGNDADARKLITALDRANALLARLDALTAKADTQVFGPDGIAKEARATLVQLNQLLAETRESLKKVDALLVEAQGIGANVRGATSDLGALRAEVEANLRKIEGMIDQLNRKWPFAKDTDVKLP